jgi:uncharacterized membrane protein
MTLPLLVSLHFLYHLVATIGVFYALWHSNDKHEKAWWKIVAAVFWLVVSVLILMGE